MKTRAYSPGNPKCVEVGSLPHLEDGFEFGETRKYGMLTAKETQSSYLENFAPVEIVGSSVLMEIGCVTSTLAAAWEWDSIATGTSAGSSTSAAVCSSILMDNGCATPTSAVILRTD
jgi:hypothetical protein